MSGEELMQQMRVMERISLAYQTLSPQLQRVADYLEKNQHHIWQLRNMDIAAACNVTPSTIARFANRFGYSGFSELQAALVSDFISRHAQLQAQTTTDVVTNITNEDVLQRLKTDIDSIQQIIRNDIIGFSRLKSSILHAHRVHVIGLGWLFSAGIYLENTLLDNEIDASVINGAGGFFINELQRIKKDDFLIVIGDRQDLQLFDELMKFNRSIKPQTALISSDDQLNNPLWASYSVIVPTNKQPAKYKRSMIAYIAFLNALVESLH